MRRSFTSVIFVALMIVGCTIGPPEPDPLKTEGATEVIKKEKGKIVLEAKLHPINEAKITSPLSGDIKRINVQVDDYVQEGMPLLYFDPTLPKAEAQGARARLARSRADARLARGGYVAAIRDEYISRREARIRFREAKTIFDNVDKKLKRMKKAHKDNAISRQELEGVENEYATADANLKVASLRAAGLARGGGGYPILSG